MKNKPGALYYLAVIFLILFCLGPIIWCFIISITPEGDLLADGSGIIPQSITWENYRSIFSADSQDSKVILLGLTNSIKISALTLLIGIPLTVLTGYILSIAEFRGKKIFVNLLLLTIVIPVFSTIIPIYNMFRNMDLLNSMLWTSFIYVSSALPLNVWIMMNYFKQMPKELWQAAAIDGFNERQTFFKVILPVASPAVLTCTLIMFLMAWKQYVIPTILLSGFTSRTITMVMSDFIARDFIRYGIIAGCGILAIVPPAIVAVLFRKFLISNMSSGTIK